MEDQLITALTGALVIIIPAIAAYVVQWLKTRTTVLKTQFKNAEFYKYLDIAENTISTVVNSISQTSVSAAKEISENGKLTDAQIEQYTAEAVDNVKRVLCQDCKDCLNEAFGDANTWLEHKIQEAVKNSKETIH